MRNLSEVTQLVNGGVGMLSQFYLMCLLFTPYCFKVLILGTGNNYRQLPIFQSRDDRDGRGFSPLQVRKEHGESHGQDNVVSLLVTESYQGTIAMRETHQTTGSITPLSGAI